MPTIVAQKLLRTGSLDFSSTTATTVDEYQIEVSERCTKEEVAVLFVSVPANPKPQGALKQLGAGFLICDRISVENTGQSLFFTLSVHWKEIENSQAPQFQSSPMPNTNSTDPDDWTPTWSKRTQVIFVPASKAFYKGGFKDPSPAHTICDKPTKVVPINSALEKVRNFPQQRKRIYQWSFRWIRKSVPQTLIDAEGKLNTLPFTFSRGGRAFTFEPHTALLDTVDLSKVRWGNLNLVEISVEIIHEPENHFIKLADLGFNRRAVPGLDKDQNGDTIRHRDGNSLTQPVRDDNDNPVAGPFLLDGDGKPINVINALDPIPDPVFISWSNDDEVDFNTVGLLSTL